ncbi:ferritin-like domain-containing protein [Desulfotomaculum copahuensis]|nr:ferritin family protein [Desulfotomaculum copahuensis]
MWYFRAKEIVEFGRRVEKNGLAFYRTVAEKTADAGVKEIFNYLAAEEEEHERIFAAMLPGLEDYNPPESYPGEYQDYVRVLVDEHVFSSDTDPVALAAKVNNALEALNLAIGFEKDSILFFYELRGLVPERERATVDKLIHEEQKHIRKLAQFKKELA